MARLPAYYIVNDDDLDTVTTLIRQRDEARAWAIYYRKMYNAAMQEVEARNQAEYAARPIDNPPPFDPVLPED